MSVRTSFKQTAKQPEPQEKKREAFTATTRIQKRTVKKKYYGKSEYTYTVYSLNIPKNLHTFLLPFLNKDLNVDAHPEHQQLTLTITSKRQNNTHKTLIQQEKHQFPTDKT